MSFTPEPDTGVKDGGDDSYALLGNPISYSRSPAIHAEFAKQTDQKINYSKIHVELDGLPTALDLFQALGGSGANITAPFKQIAFSLVDSTSERAKQAGAINTILFQPNGQRFGDNTDGVGLVRDLTLNQKIDLSGKRILILGAGGAARGILGPLVNESPTEIVIANRTLSKAIELAHLFKHLGAVRASSFPALKNSYFDLVINATSAGLWGDALSLPDNLLKNAFCYDIAYGKSFLQEAKKQGARACCNGIGMLVEQAAESFYVWRNLRPDTQCIARVIQQLLTGT